MASFAERLGMRATRTITQTDDLDVETRTELWNTFVVLRNLLDEADQRSYWKSDTANSLLTSVWAWEFKKARDEMRSVDQVWGLIKTTVMEAEWFDVLDLVEQTIKYLKQYEGPYTRSLNEILTEAFNNRFEHFLVGYRFIGQELTPVDTSAEADAINVAIDDVASIAGARHSLERATELLADRHKPDYPNSIKESISAVEAVVKKVTGKGDLGKGLADLEAAGLKIHPALKNAWVKMYGWTSDDDGIRHGGVDAANADQALAAYVLKTCSAFVSYLTEEGRKTGLLA